MSTDVAARAQESLGELILQLHELAQRASAAEAGREEALQETGRLRARVEELEAAVRKAQDEHCGCLGYLAEQGVCNCESYDCAGECCGVGNCTCTPEVLARATAEVTGRG